MKNECVYRPAKVQYYQLPGPGVEVPDTFFDWAVQVGMNDFESGRDEMLIINNKFGSVVAHPGDYIVKSIDDNFYAYAPKHFHCLFDDLIIEVEVEKAFRDQLYWEFVSENLPIEGKIVVIGNKETVDVGRYQEKPEPGWYAEDDILIYPFEEITHWQELPNKPISNVG